jgi:hypothetical protein
MVTAAAVVRSSLLLLRHQQHQLPKTVVNVAVCCLALPTPLAPEVAADLGGIVLLFLLPPTKLLPPVCSFSETLATSFQHHKPILLDRKLCYCCAPSPKNTLDRFKPMTDLPAACATQTPGQHAVPTGTQLPLATTADSKARPWLTVKQHSHRTMKIWHATQVAQPGNFRRLQLTIQLQQWEKQ